ncbi:cupin domain-containing protein [Nocardia aurantia]|nr:cupin domain-containing protein [Nocardia aurantia]
MNCCIAAGARSDPDSHNQDEVAFVYRGSGELLTGSERTALRAGDMIFLPRNVEHVFSNTGATEDLAFFSVWWPRIEPPNLP